MLAFERVAFVRIYEWNPFVYYFKNISVGVTLLKILFSVHYFHIITVSYM